MSTAEAGSESKIAGRILPLLVFLIATSLIFELPFFAFNSGNKRFQIATFIGLPLLFSAMAALVRWRRRFMEYWPAFSSYVMASAALLLMWLLDDFPGRWLGFDPQGPPGRAVVKVSDAIILLITILILGKVLQIDFDSVYLRKRATMARLSDRRSGFCGNGGVCAD